MRYSKPALTFDQQADLLLSRGISGDRDLMVERLKSVNYYRLSAYSFPFRTAPTNDRFKPGTTFEMIWERYVFDRRLRLLLIDAIERIEITVRTQLSYHHAHAFGPYAFAEIPASLPGLDPKKYKDFQQKSAREFSLSQEHFVERFRSKYAESVSLPVWMATEIMTIGQLLTFFRGCNRTIKKAVASVFAVPDDVFESWLLALNSVRNMCAHHNRVWNRVFGTKPFIPRSRKYPQWHDPFSIPNDRIFAVLSICRYCLSRVAPQSSWKKRLKALFETHPSVPVSEMGFPEDWESHSVWSPTTT